MNKIEQQSVASKKQQITKHLGVVELHNTSTKLVMNGSNFQ